MLFRKVNNPVYIYDVRMANFFIYNGGICTSTGRNRNSRNIYWCFDRDQIQEIYEKWDNYCSKNTNPQSIENAE